MDPNEEQSPPQCMSNAQSTTRNLPMGLVQSEITEIKTQQKQPQQAVQPEHLGRITELVRRLQDKKPEFFEQIQQVLDEDLAERLRELDEFENFVHIVKQFNHFKIMDNLNDPDKLSEQCDQNNLIEFTPF